VENVHGLVNWVHGSAVYWLTGSKNRSRPLDDLQPRLERPKGYHTSNLNRSNQNRWLGHCFLLRLSLWQNRAPDAMATSGEGSQTQATEHKRTQWFFLRDLEGKGASFYSLLVEQTIHEVPTAAAWSSLFLKAWHDLARASPAPRSSPKALPWSPQASHRFNCFRWRWIELTWWLSLCTRVCGLRDKIWRARATIYRAFGSRL
jgi:hypothetical protein